MERENLKDDEDSKTASSRTRSTDLDNRLSGFISSKAERSLSEHPYGFRIFEISTTPNSDLFIKPTESPQYILYNERLQEIYAKLEGEIEEPRIGACDKIIQVRNTACSSLLLRRNKSEKLMCIRSN